MNQTHEISETVLIAASPEQVWHTLTDQTAMLRWMGDKELDIRVEVVWEEGQAIKISGFHHERFENTGTVLKVEEPYLLSYTQLSSVSNLPDIPESYNIFTFTLKPTSLGTELNLTIRQFPTETIFFHLQLYWKPTLMVIKRVLEN
jgi:uncharacterized protein YndB with AHSA1/START domain